MTFGEAVRGSSDIFEPKPKEIWEIEDKEVRFVPDDNRNLHQKRYVLVVMNDELCIVSNNVFNIIPMSSQGKPDPLRFPLNKGCYSDIIDEKIVKKSNSLLVLNHYQPINGSYLVKKLGRLNDEIYEAILNNIQGELLGIPIQDDDEDESYL